MKRFVFLCALAAVVAGCQTTSVKPNDEILRVGVTPRSQPVIFKQGGTIMGIEADFAQKIGEALNREIVFVEVPWEKQLDYLEQNKTDIIMSNMTITAPRSIRVNFTTPYLQSGLSAAFIRGKHEPSGLIGSVMINQTRNVGYVKDTTGEFYAVQRFTRGTLKGFDSAEEAVKAMNNGQIDMFVHDAPVIWWLSARNERNIISFPEVLNVEPIAWAVGRHNRELLDEVNALVQQWDRDGTSSKILGNWLPSFK